MLTYDMTERNGKPKYLYLYERIREDIVSGKIGAHDKLPSKRTLASHLHLSVITVQNAYGLLEVEGYIYAKEKVGYFAEEISPRRGEKPAETVSFAMSEPDHVYFANFSSNKVQTNLYPASSMAKLTRETLSLNDARFFETVPFNGIFVLRDAIAKHLWTYRGINVSPDQIVIGCGIEYLYGRLMQLFNKDAVLGLEDPGNHKFASIAKRYGIQTEYLPIDKNGIQLDKLAESSANVVHVSPANSFPLGSVMPIRRRLELLSWLEESDDRYLIEDDFDSEINSYGNQTRPIFQNNAEDRVIYVNSFTKTLVPSLRISYIVLPIPLLARYRQTQTFYSCTVSGIDQYVLARFMGEGYFERHLNHLNAFFRQERELLEHEIREVRLNEYVTVSVPPAGTHVMLTLNENAASIEIIRKNAESLGIRFATLADYAAYPTPEMERQLVINYSSVPPERLHESLTLLRLAVSDAVGEP